MKLYAFLLLATATCAAHASFDLILIADSTNDVVHRYDGDTGLYLGNFGQGMLINPTGISVDHARGICYVGDGVTGMTAFNYSTGQALWTNPSFVNGRGFSPAPTGTAVTQLFSGATTTVAGQRIADPQNSTGVTSYTQTSPSAWGAGGYDSTGDFVMVSNTFDAMYRWAATGTTLEAFSTGATVTSVSKGDVRGTTLIALTATGQVQAVDTQSFAVTTGETPSVAFTSVIETKFGHDNYAWGLGETASGLRLQRYARQLGAGSFYHALGSFGITQVGTAEGMAVVLAPEPGTMLALLGGVGLLLRRRRS